MKLPSPRVFTNILLATAMAACTVGDPTQGRPNPEAPDAAVQVQPDATVTELKWGTTTQDQLGIAEAIHYVSETEIYAIVGEKICVWNGTTWEIHATEILGLSRAMHFVTPTEIYAVIGNKICMWDGLAWLPMTPDIANLNVAGTAEIHFVQGLLTEKAFYAVIVNGSDNYISQSINVEGTPGAWEQITDSVPNLRFAMDFKSPTEIYAVLGTKICKWTGILGDELAAWAPISPDQVGLRQAIQVVSETEMYAIINNKVCKWDGTSWTDLTADMADLREEFIHTSDENIYAVAGDAILQWAQFPAL